MLAALAIRDIVLIDKLELAFGRGLGVLTGETGAGKSILLDALTLALGGRGDGGLVRRGAVQGHVTAVFDVPAAHPVHALLEENGVAGESEVILRRIQLADGRSRAFVNDQPVSVNLLKGIGQQLVEIHGQHADRALVDPAVHRGLLDAFGRLEGQAAETGALYRAWREAQDAFRRQRERVAQAASEAEYMRHVADELRLLQPRPGEEAELAERRQAMMRAEKLAGDLNEVHEVLGGAASPGPALGAALRRLERKAAQAPALIDPIVSALDRALASLDEAQAALEAALHAADFDPKELERIEERLFALRAAARKHNVLVDALPALAEKISADLAEIESGEERLGALEAAEKAARQAYEAAARALSAARHAAARDLDAAVNGELAPLRLERARFETVIETGFMEGESGIDRVQFWAQTNPGTNPGPILKVASGGELARFLLALKVVLADRGSAPTLVFDEVDTGVGGAVADAIGARLGRLGERVQVLAVTHAPQVAARADRHFLITKEPAGDTVVTRVKPLKGAARREEIARMLAGARITDEARAAAARLMAGTG